MGTVHQITILPPNKGEMTRRVAEPAAFSNACGV